VSERLSTADTEALIALRRDLHAHPELGYAEQRTSQVVAAWLRASGFEAVHEGIAQTGVVAVLDSGQPGPVIGFRADIDALPIQEQTQAPYQSCHPGRMHACGHDVHTTIGLGIARHLARHRPPAGKVVFVFQPNEEGAPGAGLSGADAMVAAGVLDTFQLQHMMALHCMPSLPVGTLGYCPSGVWAGSDRLLIDIEGQQTHAAYPHLGIDPIVVAAHLITALQTVSSRAIDAQSACVLSITKVSAGDQFNVISSTARLEGILRTLHDDVRQQALAAAARIIDHVPQGFGARATLHTHRGASPVVNDRAFLSRCLDLLRGPQPLTVAEVAPQMGAEDFSAFSQRVPSVYWLLGVRNDALGLTAPLHSPLFDVDEGCIPLAVTTMSRLLTRLTSP
jgi:amidohydrolase